uniref:DNA-directed RNA polymerase subunit n=1 Tax=Pteridomonas sp. YPF1301 TaxID=2766739 RepID=A0A7G1MRL3_9STRA|nr:RNA polymerase b'-subunit [Pteridomonas sp. YPF1301]
MYFLNKINMTHRKVSFDFLSIQLASPTQIKKWGTYRRTNGLEFGQILTDEILAPGTLQPSPDGLFCEKIFGPTTQDKCFCGKEIKKYQIYSFCETCNVEFSSSQTRRYRMGYILLKIPVTHIWYLYGMPSYLSLLLNLNLKILEDIIYYTTQYYLLSTENKRITFFFNNSIYDCFNGANLLKYLLNNLVLESEIFYCKLLLHLYKFNKIRTLKSIFLLKNMEPRLKLIKRIRLLENFIATEANPSWLILDILPVLPPMLRPLRVDEQGTVILSDLTHLYLNILKANNNLIKKLNSQEPLIFINNAQRFLQEAVDNLIDNERRNITIKTDNNSNLASLSSLLGSKYGRFRENLLGKRVDYSGRSVIVVAPFLKLTQCGLPYRLAIELFKPFLLQQLLRLNSSLTLDDLQLIFLTEKSFIIKLLTIIIRTRFILLNRAPTLHRLGIQAFTPILIEGYAIGLHPLICSSLNADFDGDQVAIHLPLTLKAQIEAKTLIAIPNNILSITTGEPIIIPTQDMIIGYNYLTLVSFNRYGTIYYFNDYQDILNAYEQQVITLQSPIWVRHIKSTNIKFNPIRSQFKKLTFNSSNYFLTTFGRLLLNKAFFKILFI